MQAEIIQRFLESVGQKADVDLYLKLFRAQQKESFAVIVADAQIVRSALDPLHFDLRILAGLGLCPVVLIGLSEPREAEANAQRVQEWLREDDVPSCVIACAPDLPAPDIDRVRQAITAQQIPLLSLQNAADVTAEARFALLQKLTSTLETRKVIFLSSRAGLGKTGGAFISNINLQSDFDRLVDGPLLSRRQSQFLRQTKTLLERAPHRMSVAVVNPLALLRELFTIAGAGTLIRRGSPIETHAGTAGVDQGRLIGLIESAFGRKLRDEALAQPWERVYLEPAYRAAVMLLRTPAGVYLSKFVVERQAQGEGIGGDMWTALTRDYPSFFWRARPDNPIAYWYTRQCDGLLRTPEWHVYWRGLSATEIPAAVQFACAQPPDLVPA